MVTHGIGATIVLSCQHQIIKKSKENPPQVSFVINAQEKKKKGIVKK
jgi:hypothetical protein